MHDTPLHNFRLLYLSLSAIFGSFLSFPGHVAPLWTGGNSFGRMLLLGLIYSLKRYKANNVMSTSKIVK